MGTSSHDGKCRAMTGRDGLDMRHAEITLEQQHTRRSHHFFY
jgi:hypothetical protein